MSLNIKRYRYLIPISIIFLGILTYYGTHRIISVNVGNGGKITTNTSNTENTIDLFDTTQVHEIKIQIAENEYKNMLDTYANTLEKDWYKADITIDGVTIYNVGIRLKGEYSLIQIGLNNGLKQKNSKTINYNGQFPLLIKFNKYTDQTYQGHEMISLRVGMMGPDPTLLSEPYSYELYQAVGQPSPDTSYGSVQIDGKDPKLFIISEIPEDKYFLQKRFGDDNGILYKAGNFVNFVYLLEDPTSYSNYYTQKTRVHDYDISPLIKMLKFITESDNEEFEQEVDNYIDVKSVISLLAIDTFAGNRDSFGGMGSNYYLYYHLGEQKFYILTWDQNLALGIAGGGPGGFSQGFSMHPELQSDKPIIPEFKGGNTRQGMGNNGFNVLKPRLLSNEKFRAMYYDIYNNIEEIALDSNFSENLFEEWSNSFLEYNKKTQLLPESSYLQGLMRLKNYLENMKKYRDKSK